VVVDLRLSPFINMLTKRRKEGKISATSIRIHFLLAVLSTRQKKGRKKSGRLAGGVTDSATEGPKDYRKQRRGGLIDIAIADEGGEREEEVYLLPWKKKRGGKGLDFPSVWVLPERRGGRPGKKEGSNIIYLATKGEEGRNQPTQTKFVLHTVLGKRGKKERRSYGQGAQSDLTI